MKYVGESNNESDKFSLGLIIMSSKNTKPHAIIMFECDICEKNYMFFDCVAHIYPAGKNDVAPKWAN